MRRTMAWAPVLTWVVAVVGIVQGQELPDNYTMEINLTLSDLQYYEGHLQLHLAEGTHQRWVYNASPEQCARRCSYSAREQPDRVACRSFEFYPFEEAKAYPPWNEKPENGICVLNSESFLTGKIRYEDEGLTDAELMYTSHFTHRFTSTYYHGIDAGYGQNPIIYGDKSPNRIPWTFSRLGAIIVREPEVYLRRFACVNSLDQYNATAKRAIVLAYERSTVDESRAGFAPVGVTTGKCPGLVTRVEATAICTDAAASLCTQRELRMLFNENLGCDIDGEDGVMPVWGLDDLIPPGKPELKYVKCCTTHRRAFTCDSYNASNIRFCKSLKNEASCVREGSGFSRQVQSGFGRLLQDLRRDCSRNENSCSQAASSTWIPRDNCIWCGNDCRPGSDFGVCGSLGTTTDRFSKQFSTQCTPQAACDMYNSYANLGPLLVDPFETVQGSDDEPTSSPTKPASCQTLLTPQDCNRYYNDCFWGTWFGKPVCRNLSSITSRPSRPPPTNLPTKKPPTKRPTKQKNNRRLLGDNNDQVEAEESVIV